MWVRGLKHRSRLYCPETYPVAPYVGAWIETSLPLSREMSPNVAPYVGAWIETVREPLLPNLRLVAPYVGAWIETRLSVSV